MVPPRVTALSGTVNAAVVVLSGLALVATPGGRHARRLRPGGGQDASQLPAGPAGYGNVEVLDRNGTGVLTYEGTLYCPGAEFLNVTLAVVTPEGETVASTAVDACTSTADGPCTVSDTVALEPGTHWANMTFDVNDPQEDAETGREPEYQGTRRTQRYRWLGMAQPVPTRPELGYVRFNPPCV